ncbi:MAG: aminopeptidase N [Azoarcus sp.]|jgi:aminopeptidase N|nr:aminopeptidase N [Azoarcus sp.]
MNAEQIPTTVHRTDYRPLAWVVEHVDLHFHLDPVTTIVTNRMTCVRNPLAEDGPLRLWEDGVERLSILVDGEPAALRAVDGALEIGMSAKEDGRAEVVVSTRISPGENTALSGLYLSNGGFFTQCEAEGFRRITCFPDRPDVMARYTVTLEAERARYPVLLANGNLVERGELSSSWHYARWEDPFPKPSYLFALVAARLVALEREVRTASGRPVLLQVWVEEGNLDRAGHALDSLVHAMRWDEACFGLELDLDRFMIVAVADFNMGAMENKGLNIFNAKYVLATPETATDDDYAGIETVVAHEYFHNWTGNRVTCRDWFQLTLKEGLTVFRDQQFSADMLARAAGEEGAVSARAVERIDNVRTLRAAQFPEDGGPMAHPIRPESYREINNFYTATVYEKGAEVVRMLHTLLGPEGFRNGMDLYFSYHDGQAVTCDDFVDAMAEANGADLDQFMRWYEQAGTPRLAARGQWHADSGCYALTLSQSTPPMPGQADKQPLVIPVAVGLIGPDGRDLPLRLEGESGAGASTRVLVLDSAEKTFRFAGIDAEPVPSVLRGFSAPVILDIEEDDARLAFRMARDADPFNRWDAAQRYSERVILALAADPAAALPAAYVDACRALLGDDVLDPAFRAKALTPPAEGYLLERMTPADPLALRAALIALTRGLGTALAHDCHAFTQPLWMGEPYRYHPAGAGQRALASLALRYLAAGGDVHGIALARARFESATNMTECMGALAALMTTDEPAREEALAAFRARHDGDALTLDKWFALQAGAWRWHDKAEPVLARVRVLMEDPAFSLSNPNKVYALLGAFFRGNPGEFHAEDGGGHAFWAEQVLALDARNPQVAARMARAMEGWRRYVPALRESMRARLEEVRAGARLSSDVAEIIDRALGTEGGAGDAQ